MNEQDEFKDNRRFNLGIWKRLLPFLKPIRGLLLSIILMMLFGALIDTVIPLFASYAVDHFVTAQSTEGFGLFTLVYFLVIAFQSALTYSYSQRSMQVEMGTGKRMKRACFEHLQRLPLSYYNTNSVGYILARVMSDTDRISGTIAWTMMFFCWEVFYLIGILIAMFALNWQMALLVLTILPFFLAAAFWFQPRLLAAGRLARHMNSRITGAYNESISGAKTSKTLVIEEQNTAEFQELTSQMYAASFRSSQLSAIFLPLVTFFGSFAVALVLARSGSLVIGGKLEFGILSAFISYGILILEPLNQIARMLSELVGVQVNIERVSALLDEPETIRDTPEVIARYGGIFDARPEAYPPLTGDISFEHVSFAYPDAPEEPVLSDVSFHAAAGETVAIVGETGAGKSTLVNLLCRFFEPTAGTIKIDGEDYRTRSLGWLHSNLGYVQQDPHLFSGTLLDNIRYSCPEASQEEVAAAARLVSVDVVAAHLENGYLTDVGEGGDRLSTGEKQLVSFARAVIRKPPIFILDEATSSIDTETEQLIQNAITRVLEGRTSFIIAHRLSTIRNADLILYIEGHGIAERGTHEELMARRGKYYQLYESMKVQTAAENR